MNSPSYLFRVFLGSLTGLLLSIPSVYSAANDIKFSGFATFAYAQTISDNNEGKLQNISRAGEYRAFNRLGLQMDADLQDKLTFTAQITAHGKNDYELNIDWLFATYHFLPNVGLSIGKLRLPLYMYSDYLDVGYAYQWIVPPDSVYGVPSFSSMEGLKLSWYTNWGEDWNSEVLLWGGRTDEPAEELEGENIIIENGLGLAWLVERDWLALRAVYFQGVSSADISQQTAPLNAGIDGLEAGIQALSGDATFSLATVHEDLAYADEDSLFMGVGAFLDFDHFFMASEFTVIDVDKTVAVGELKSAYIMAGVRLAANWSLSLTYSVDRENVNKPVYQELEKLTAPYQGLDPSIPGGVEAIVQAVKTIQTLDTDVWTLSSRWDFHKSASLKMEFLMQEDNLLDAVTAEEIKLEPRAFRIAVDMVF